MPIIRIILLIGCLLGVNILLPKVINLNPWIAIFLGYVAFTSVFLIYNEFVLYKKSKE